jgi:hypothetical protein
MLIMTRQASNRLSPAAKPSHQPAYGESAMTPAMSGSGTAPIDPKHCAGARDVLSNCMFDDTNVGDPVSGGHCTVFVQYPGLVILLW